MLETMRIDRVLYERLYGLDPFDEHVATWKALLDRDWIRVQGEHLTLIGDGVFYTPLVQGLLAADRLEELRRSRVAGGGSATEALREVGS